MQTLMWAIPTAILVVFGLWRLSIARYIIQNQELKETIESKNNEITKLSEENKKLEEKLKGEALKELKKKQKEHYGHLADLAKIFSHRIGLLITGKFTGNIVDGLHRKFTLKHLFGMTNSLGEQVDGINMGQPINNPPNLDLYLLCHFNQIYPEFDLKSWGNINVKNDGQQIMSKLSTLAESKSFKPCDHCDACQRILMSHMEGFQT